MLGISWILTDIDITGHKYWTNYTWRLPATKPYSVWTKNTSTPGIDSAANNMTIECVQKWEMAPNLWSSATINHHKPWLEGTVFSKYLSTNYFHSSGYIKCSWKHKTMKSLSSLPEKRCMFFFADWKLFTVFHHQMGENCKTLGHTTMTRLMTRLKTPSAPCFPPRHGWSVQAASQVSPGNFPTHMEVSTP